MTRVTRMTRPGISLVETAISVAIVGGLLAAAISTSGVVAAARKSVSQRTFASVLAKDLAMEISATAYDETSAAQLDAVKLDGGEVVVSETVKVVEEPIADVKSPGRSGFDDVDDYASWSSTPPVDRSGTQVSGASGMTRSVTIQNVDPDAPEKSAGSDLGLKRITVVVSIGDKQLASASVFRSRSRDETEVR